jgi:hypothetical protein
MTGLVRKATLLSVCGLLVAGAALAAVPSPTNSTIPNIIHLVGANGAGTVVDPVGTYTVIIKDLANNPVQNSSVVVDFSLCGTFDTNMGTVQNHPGVTLDCPTKTVRGLTDATGTFSFRVRGAAHNTGNLAGNNTPCGRVFADGVIMKATAGIGGATNLGTNGIIVSTYNENGAADNSGFTALDLSAFAGDFFSANYYTRSDFNGDGIKSPLDLSNMAGVFFSMTTASATGSAAFCP